MVCLRTYVHKKGGRATVTAPPPPRPGRPPAGARRPAAALRRARRRRVVARSATHPVRPPRAPGSQRTTAVKTLPPANDQQQADARADGEWTADAVPGLRRIVRPHQGCDRRPWEASVHRAHARPKGDKKLSLKILIPNLRAAGEPSAREIDKAKRAALRAVHPDLLMGSPELISADPAGLKTCLVEYPNVKG